MTNKYTDAFLYSAKPPIGEWKDSLQEQVSKSFYNSSNWMQIQQEEPFGSKIWVEVDARINHLVNPTTGLNWGDDWKKLLFEDIQKELLIGTMFYFSNNYWLIVNAETIGNITSNAIVRRCNNLLRWVDADGGKHAQPCVLDYEIQENRDYATAGSALINPSGILSIATQLNSESNAIYPNQRFLFGNADNWTAYRVFGGGINNFMNLQTSDVDTAGLLMLSVGVTQLNDHTDDIVNGYADLEEREFVLNIVESSISGNIATTIQLTADLTKDGLTHDGTVLWSSSDVSIATVSSSGLVTFVADGTCTITAEMENRPDVSDTCPVTVTAAPVSEYQIVLSPAVNYVYEGQTTVFSAYLVLNGSVQPDAFTFSLNPNTVPSTNYAFNALTGNTFSIQNITMYLEDTLEITCQSGAHSKVVEVQLKGMW